MLIYTNYSTSTHRTCVMGTQPAFDTMQVKRVIAYERMPHNAVLLVTDRTKFSGRWRLVRYTNIVLYRHYPLRSYGHYVQCFCLAETRIQGIHTVLYNVLIGMLRGVVQPGLDALSYAVFADRMRHPQLHRISCYQIFIFYILLLHIHPIVLIPTAIRYIIIHFDITPRKRTLQPRQVHVHLWNLFLAYIPFQCRLRGRKN